MKRLITLLTLGGLLWTAGEISHAAENNDPLDALVLLLQESDDPQFQLDLLKGISEGLKGRREMKMPEGWEAAAARLQKSENASVRELSKSLSLTFGSASAQQDLQRTVQNRNESPGNRRKALDALMQSKSSGLLELLKGLLDDPAVRAQAIRGLAAFDDSTVPSAVLRTYPSLTASEKKDALNTLVARVPSARALLAAVAADKVPRKDLTADIVRQLRNLKNPELAAEVTRVWGVTRESEADKLKEIARFKDLIAQGPEGEPGAGRLVFNRVCLQCHMLFDVGGKVGPDITGSNRADLDYLLQNVIDPNAVIPNDYRTSTIDTKDERVITGIVTRQDDNSITIVTANEQLILPRAEVQSIQQGEVSMMPEGLLESLSGKEVRDLVAYLKSPKQVPLPAK